MKQIVKYGLGCLMLVGSSLLTTSCNDDDMSSLTAAIYPKSVEMEISDELQAYLYTDETGATALPVIKGATVTLGCTLTPADVTYPEVTWASSNQEVATISDKGVVTAVGGGYTIIQVAPSIAYSGSGIYKTLKVVVSNTLVEAQAIALSSQADEVFAGETLQLTATITPVDATYKTVKWVSSDESIAKVDKNGLVTGQVSNQFLAPVTITATSLDGAAVVAQKIIQVKQIVQPEEVTLDQTYVAPGYHFAISEKNYAIAYTTVPVQCTTSLIVWKSSDEAIATVTNGVVTLNQQGVFGDVTITATCPETGNSSSVKLHVAEGLIRELFHNENNITWDLTAAHKKSGGTSTWSYGKMHVTTYAANATTQRGDFTKTDEKIWLNASNYPIFAFRMTDVLDDYTEVTSRNISMDTNTSDGSYKGHIGGGNNKWSSRYKLDDGSYVFIYDLSTLLFQTGGLLKGTVAFTTFQWKYADIKSVSSAVAYDVYWVQSFKNLNDVKAYVASEGRTIIN